MAAAAVAGIGGGRKKYWTAFIALQTLLLVQKCPDSVVVARSHFPAVITGSAGGPEFDSWREYFSCTARRCKFVTQIGHCFLGWYHTSL